MPIETSIIMSSFHSEKYIKEAVDSIINQINYRWELIIIDDTNGEGKVETYADHKIPIFTYNTDDIGLSALRMFGVNKAKGKYLLFIDADDKLHPNFLQKTVRVMETNLDISIAYTDTQHFDGANTYWEQPEYNFHDLLINNYMCACSLIRRKDFEAAGGFDLNNFNYWEDYENWIQMGAKGYYGKHIPEKLYYYRIRSTSGMQSKRNDILSPLYKAYIINKFSVLYPKQWQEQAKDILSLYPADIMKWKPKEQEEYLKKKGLLR
jgi:glycosyltransferase involved in cell wall biosynthesis